MPGSLLSQPNQQYAMDQAPQLGALAMSPESAMEQMSWEELQRLRMKYQGNQAMQEQIAPYEHRAYAREQVANNKWLAPAYAVLPAGYQLAKAMNLTPSDNMSTGPSLKQMTQGMAGAWDGLRAGI